MLRTIFKNQSVADAPEALKQYFVDQLWDAVIKGYGNDLDDVDFDTPDHDMLEALQSDTIRFAAAKSGVMNAALFNELTDSNGRIRSWTEFRNVAYQVTGSHTQSWLKAERNLAITSAQAASKWVNIEANAETLPILQFDAVIDDSTTEICLLLNGVTLPWDHPFWDIWYIPNHYGERSLIRQLDDAELTNVDDIIYPEKIPAMFKVNLAKQKKVFPPDHPYYGK